MKLKSCFGYQMKAARLDAAAIVVDFETDNTVDWGLVTIPDATTGSEVFETDQEVDYAVSSVNDRLAKVYWWKY